MGDSSGKMHLRGASNPWPSPRLVGVLTVLAVLGLLVSGPAGDTTWQDCRGKGRQERVGSGSAWQCLNAESFITASGKARPGQSLSR